MNRIWRKLQWSIAQRGVLGTLRLMLRRGVAGEDNAQKVHPFDLRYGTDTGGVVGGGELGAGHPHDAHITAYAGMPPSRFAATMERWFAGQKAVAADAYHFIDVGCGKGRVVLLASQYSFAQVIGVELDPGLTKIARENVERFRAAGLPVSPVEIVGGDATEFRLPNGPCLLYLANPFGAPVLRRLLEASEERIRTGGSGVDLIYQNAAHRAVFDEFPAWRLLWDEVFGLSEEDAVVEPVYGAEDRCAAWRRDGR